MIGIVRTVRTVRIVSTRGGSAFGGKTVKMEVKKFEAVTGLGVKGRMSEKQYHFGSSKYMKQVKVPDKESLGEIERMQEKGYTVLCLADEKKVLALFGVQELRIVRLVGVYLRNFCTHQEESTLL